jgi:integral membrane protein
MSANRTTTTPARPPRPIKATAAQIRTALKLYKVAAMLTGTFLLLLCLEMIAKYAFHYELIVGGVNLSLTVLIVHGWLYVFYLFTDFNLFTKLRWSLGRFLLIALGGVIPFLSFILEARVHREVEAQLDTLEAVGPRY